MTIFFTLLFITIICVVIRNVYYMGYYNGKTDELNKQIRYMKNTGDSLYEYYMYNKNNNS